MNLEPINIPPHGQVRYIDHLGSDMAIVNAARHSYGGASKGEVADRKLLHALYRRRHTSPFEQSSITFFIRMPIFVMRQFVRHRTFRLNEISARYVQLPDYFWLPTEGWRVQHPTEKQVTIAPENKPLWWHREQTGIVDRFNEHAYQTYQQLVDNGVGREQARCVLPVGIYTDIVVNCDVHNLMHFFRLRRDPHAQGEIQDVANAMFQIFEKLFPWCASAYNRYKVTVEDLEADTTI